MFSRILSATAVALAASSMVNAQTFTDCNPTEKTCPDNAALGTTLDVDFTKGPHPFFKELAGTKLNYDNNGAIFTINKETDAPTMAAAKYIFFGKVDVTLTAAPGAGIITSFVLQSDDLDEIDWEWVGNDAKQVQTNYFGKGDTTTYDRGKFHDDPNSQFESHTYTIDWTKDHVKWYINGNLVRTLLYSEAKDGSRFPQTPMQIKLGSWVAGRKDAAEGTVQWGGGYADFSKGPFIATYQSIKIQDYSTGATSYSYGDKTGSWQSIKVIKDGSSSDSSSSSASVSASASASATEKTTAKSISFTPESTLVSSFSSLTTPTGPASVTKTGSATGSATETGTTTGTTTDSSSSSSSSATSTAVVASGAFKQGLEMGNMVVMGAGLFFGYLLL